MRRRIGGSEPYVRVGSTTLGPGSRALPGGGEDWFDDDADYDADYDDGTPLAAAPRAARAGTRPPGGRTRARRNGVEGNARLTGTTAAILLVLLAFEGMTILRIFSLLTIHVFIGMLLIPIVLVKIGSVTWRFAKYYLGDPEYRRRGPPAPLLRLLGPILIVLTLVLLFSGVALVLVPQVGGTRTALLRVHQVSFVLWFMAMAVHVVGHILETAKLAPRDWYWRTRRQVRGASSRQWALISSIVVGIIVGVVMLPTVGVWLAGIQPAAHTAAHTVPPTAPVTTTTVP